MQPTWAGGRSLQTTEILWETPQPCSCLAALSPLRIGRSLSSSMRPHLHQRSRDENLSAVQIDRRSQFKPELPPVLKAESLPSVREGSPTKCVADAEQISDLFPSTFGQPILQLLSPAGTARSASGRTLRIGVVLSGGQSPGGHNVICGIFDRLKLRNADSKLFGFLAGPIGLMNGDFIEVNSRLVERYRNLGGFDMIGTGRDKIETASQFLSSRNVCGELKLDGLVVVGGDDSNTNAAMLAEYFASHHCHTKVVGCPKTIDGDLKHDLVETSFGFDSATKVYSALIANIASDANSSRKYYHFIRLMGRSASHITLECALQTHPNVVLIGEEVEHDNLTLLDITNHICDVVMDRSRRGKNFGIILLPEGLIEFIPEIHNLIGQLNEFMAQGIDVEHVRGHLSDSAQAVFDFLPPLIREELLLDRDPHGNVQVSKIQTEKLLMELVTSQLKMHKASGLFKGKFNCMGHFFGYEGRCVMPSNFDATYCYALGHTAAILIEEKRTGYMAAVHNLAAPVSQWSVGGVPIPMMMNVERRKGKDKPVIQKALVRLDGRPFAVLKNLRKTWQLVERYRNPGPIQYYGPFSNEPTITLQLEAEEKRMKQGNPKSRL